MTIENWLMIAVIISTLIAPTLALFIQSLISQPKPTPELSQPKNRIQRIGDWLAQSPWLPWVLVIPILLNIYILLKEFHNTTPVTRGVVVLIAVAVAGIAFNFLNINNILALQTNWMMREGIRSLWEGIRSLWERLAKDSESMAKIDLKILEIIEEVRTTMKREDDALRALIEVSLPVLAPVPTKPKRTEYGVLERLVSAIKALLRDDFSN
jgi:hypothetical protein